ncbi:MAG: hypothetical protein ACREKI_03555 [Gemmatimonadota bacterium]
MDRTRVTFLTLTGLSLATLAVVSVAVTPSWLRLLLSLAAVLPGYAGALFLWHTPSARRKAASQTRRFFALRSTTDRFLEEVRRLNALRVDVHTGQKSPREARPELVEIEQRMGGLIAEMREVAGQVTPASGFPPGNGGLS